MADIEMSLCRRKQEGNGVGGGGLGRRAVGGRPWRLARPTHHRAARRLPQQQGVLLGHVPQVLRPLLGQLCPDLMGGREESEGRAGWVQRVRRRRGGRPSPSSNPTHPRPAKEKEKSLTRPLTQTKRTSMMRCAMERGLTPDATTQSYIGSRPVSNLAGPMGRASIVRRKVSPLTSSHPPSLGMGLSRMNASSQWYRFRLVSDR